MDEPMDETMDEPTDEPTDDAAVTDQLRELRGSTAERRATLRRDFDRIVEAAQSVSTDDEHDPEGSTIAFERAQVAALLDQADRQLAELDAAVARLDAGSYGRCVACGRPIGAERLLVRPAATRCIACAR
jgi:DnaK suppressor protein